MNNQLFLLGLFLFLGACQRSEFQSQNSSILPFYNSAEFTPEWIDKTDVQYDSIHTIPDFSFVNQDGDTITAATFKNKIYVADFFFTTCPGICPKLTKNMQHVQKTFEKDPEVYLISHTVMPWVDSVAQLKSYAIDHEIDDGKWHLVTGDKEDIYRLARQHYFAELEAGIEKSIEAFLHTENFLLIDQKKRIRGIYNGTLEVEVNRLIEDILILKQESKGS